MADGNPICSICLETFKDPTTIPCNHVFCSGCIKRHEEKNARDGSFACPLCNREVQIPVEGGTIIQDEAANQRGISREEMSLQCDVCGPKISATSRCLDCEENYCQVCSASHIKMKSSRNHTLRELGVLAQEEKATLHRREFCTEHPEEEIKIVCKTCKNIPLCLFCKISEHDSHKSRTLAEEAGEVKIILEKNLATYASKLECIRNYAKESADLAREIHTSEREEIIMVTNKENELVRLLECQIQRVKTRAEKLRQDIRQIYETVQQLNDNVKKNVAEELSHCVTLHSQARKLIDNGTDFQIVQTGHNVSKSLLEECKQNSTIGRIKMRRKAFVPANISVQTVSLKFGCLSRDIITEKMHIFLRSFNDWEQIFSLDIYPFERIADIKKKIAIKSSITVGGEVVLRFVGKELKNDRSVRDYDIRIGSTIEYFVRKFQAPVKMNDVETM